MFEIRAKCDNSRCSPGIFTVERREVVKKNAAGRDYAIQQVVCPQCRMWARITGIKKKS